jgi:hypothetical protein
MRLLVILLLLLTPAYVHAGPSKIYGLWKLDAVRTKDGPVPKDKLAGGGMTWELKADNVLVMTVWKGKESVVVNAKWTMSANTIDVDENGQINKMTWKVLKNGKLELGGMPGKSTVVMTFVKSKPKKK